MNSPLKPEDIIDAYYTFRKEDLLNWLAQRGTEGVNITAANFIGIFDQMQEEIGKKYFVMDSGDPLVATIVVAYVKLLNSKDRMTKKLLEKRDESLPKN